MAKNDKKKITQTEQPTVQAPAPAEPTLTGERQQFGQPVQQGFGGGSLGVNTDLNNPTTPTAAPTEQATPAKSATQELIDSIKAESEEERQRIERRRRAEETISGIADMGKALNNLYFTSKGAPNMYDPKTAMTPKARERYERALKNWEKNRAASMQYALSKQSAELRQQQLDESERHHKEQEDYNRARMEMEAAKQQWKELLADKQLSLKEKIAMMNDATKRWSTSMRLSQATIAHTLQPYIVTEEDMYDKDGRKIGKKKTRLIIDNNGNVKDIKTEEERNTTTTTSTTTTAKPSSGSLLPKSGNSNSTSTKAKGTLLPNKSK
jgi:hypothetical protein